MPEPSTETHRSPRPLAAPPPVLGPPHPEYPNDLGTVGPYRVVELLGEGGMGYVFRAVDDSLRRTVALKVMKPTEGDDAKHRFLREGRAAAALRSDHIVVIYGVGGDKTGELPYLAMEYLPGRTLADWLKERGGKLPPSEVVRVARHALRGLAAAHAAGSFHRDIKPSNLWVEETSGRVKLLDFGIAKTVGDAKLTHTGQALGTPAYMSPEQARALPIDGRADLFSLGVVVYELLTGISPFDKGNATASVIAVATEEPKPAKDVVPAVPAELSMFVARLMSKDPAGRPKDAVAAMTELAAIDTRLKTHESASQPVVVLELESAAPLAASVVERRGSSPPSEASPPAAATRPLRQRGEGGGDQPRRSRGTRFLLLGVAAVIAVATAAVLLPDRGFVPTPTSLPDSPPTVTQASPDTRPTPTQSTSTRPLSPTSISTPLTKPTPTPPPPITRKGGDEVDFLIAPGVKMRFCWVPPGEAQLGSPVAERQAVLKLINAAKELDWLAVEAESVRGKFATKGFWLAKFEVTQDEWVAVTSLANPSTFDGTKNNPAMGLKTGRFPVENVLWNMAVEFCNAVSLHAKRTPRYEKVGEGWKVVENANGFRLPNENEWEYACRGGNGNHQPFYFGDALNGDKANCDGYYPYGTDKKGDSLNRTDRVGAYEVKAPHPWGLCDLHGNVWEWCENTYDKSDDRRVLRGGSWDGFSHIARAAFRHRHASGSRFSGVGFRLLSPQD